MGTNACSPLSLSLPPSSQCAFLSHFGGSLNAYPVRFSRTFPTPQSTQQVWSTYLLRALVMAYIQAITHGIYMTYRKLVID